MTSKIFGSGVLPPGRTQIAMARTSHVTSHVYRDTENRESSLGRLARLLNEV